jgi:uncharacterized protein
MSPEIRYVFDNNALVSALIFADSVPGRALHAALNGGKLLVSEATFAELGEVLRRKKFDRYATREERQQFLILLLRDAILVTITQEIRACRDAKDDKFLELAVSGDARCLVTGDKDLLALNPFRDIPVLTPAQFLASSSQTGEGR